MNRKVPQKHIFKIWSPFKRNADWSPRWSGYSVSTCCSKALVRFLRELNDSYLHSAASICRCHRAKNGVVVFKHIPSGVLFCVSR